MDPNLPLIDWMGPRYRLGGPGQVNPAVRRTLFAALEGGRVQSDVESGLGFLGESD
jgi:hypothetical protein